METNMCHQAKCSQNWKKNFFQDIASLWLYGLPMSTT